MHRLFSVALAAVMIVSLLAPLASTRQVRNRPELPPIQYVLTQANLDPDVLVFGKIH